MQRARQALGVRAGHRHGGAVLAIEHREQQVSGADLGVPESVGHRKGPLGDHSPGGRAKDAGRLVKRMRAIARRQIDRLTDRAKLAVFPDRRENPRREAVRDLQAADQQMKWVDFAMLQQRGGFGGRPDGAPGIRGEPFKRRHRRPRRPRLLGHRRVHQLRSGLRIAQGRASRRVLRVDQSPEIVETEIVKDRLDAPIIDQREEYMHTVRATLPSLGRHCYRPQQNLLAGSRSAKPSQHEVVSHSVGTNNRRMQVRRGHPALSEQIPDLPSPREGKEQMLRLNARAPQHPRLILSQQNELRRITAKQAHQSIMTDRCLTSTRLDYMSAGLTHHRPPNAPAAVHPSHLGTLNGRLVFTR